jgi:hypothetical protein
LFHIEHKHLKSTAGDGRKAARPQLDIPSIQPACYKYDQYYYVERVLQLNTALLFRKVPVEMGKLEGVRAAPPFQGNKSSKIHLLSELRTEWASHACLRLQPDLPTAWPTIWANGAGLQVRSFSTSIGSYHFRMQRDSFASI